MSERDLTSEELAGVGLGEVDPDRAHGEFLLGIFDQEKRRRQDDELLNLLNDAHRQTRQTSEDGQQ